MNAPNVEPSAMIRHGVVFSAAAFLIIARILEFPSAGTQVTVSLQTSFKKLKSGMTVFCNYCIVYIAGIVNFFSILCTAHDIPASVNYIAIRN